MFSPEVLSQTVTNTKKCKSPSGVSCYFIKLDDEWGIKVYNSESTRDRGAANQEEMSKHSYGPKVGNIFHVGNKYCYTTQIAIPIVEATTEEEDYYSTQFPRIRKMQNENPNIDNDIHDLIIKMRNVGFDMNDVHYANFGWLNGNVVCIDFAE